MAIVTRTIGATGRHNSTLQQWEDDLDDTGLYSAGDVALGECYDDSTFTDKVTINDAVIGLSQIQLSVAAGERHDGTDSTGVTVSADPGQNSALIYITSSSKPTIAEWLVLTPSSAGTNRAGARAHSNGVDIIRRCVIDCSGMTHSGCYGIHAYRDDCFAIRNIIYDSPAAGIYIDTPSEDTYVDANTIYNCVVGISCNEVVTTVRGNICVGNTTDYGGANTPNTASYNLDEDSTAWGTNSQTSDAATEFVSTTAGSEDLKIVTGATAKDNGTDLGSTYERNVDIEGDTVTGTWDIGAHEFDAAPAAGPNMLTLLGVG